MIDHALRLNSPLPAAAGGGGAGAPQPAPPAVDHAVGALFGEQTGARVEIMTSFEAKIDLVEGRAVLDAAFLKDKVNLRERGRAAYARGALASSPQRSLRPPQSRPSSPATSSSDGTR